MLLQILAAALLQPTPAEAAMAACLGEPDAERLACFDAAATMLDASAPERAEAVADQAEAPRPPVIGARSDAAPPRTVPVTAPPPEPASDFGLPTRRDADETLTVTVQSVTLDRYGNATVTLTDGQVWRQLTSDSAKVSRGLAKRAETATIKPAALGSYRLTIEPSGRTIRARRVR